MKQNDMVKGTSWGHIWVIREGFCKEVACEPKPERQAGTGDEAVWERALQEG